MVRYSGDHQWGIENASRFDISWYLSTRVKDCIVPVGPNYGDTWRLRFARAVRFRREFQLGHQKDGVQSISFLRLFCPNSYSGAVGWGAFAYHKSPTLHPKHQSTISPARSTTTTASVADTANYFVVETTNTIAGDNILNFKLRYTNISYSI